MLLCENAETTNVMGKILLGGNVFGFYTVWFLTPGKFFFFKQVFTGAPATGGGWDGENKQPIPLLLAPWVLSWMERIFFVWPMALGFRSVPTGWSHVCPSNFTSSRLVDILNFQCMVSASYDAELGFSPVNDTSLGFWFLWGDIFLIYFFIEG